MTGLGRTLAGLAVAGCLALSGAPAAAQGFGPEAGPPITAARFSDVRVDVRPLLARGGGLQAEALRADLTEALRRNFADRIGGSGPGLVVRITGLSLRDYVGGSSGRGGFGGGMQNDYLEGEALLVDRRGAVLGRHPQLAAVPSSYGGAWYEPGAERRRLAGLADIYAQWLRRALPAN